jgi:hypothetical protein
MLRVRETTLLRIQKGMSLWLGILVCALAVAVVAAAGVWRVHQRGGVLMTAYDLRKAERVYMRLVDRNRLRELELSTVKHPNELNIEAREQMGLIPALPERRVEVP